MQRHQFLMQRHRLLTHRPEGSMHRCPLRVLPSRGWPSPRQGQPSPDRNPPSLARNRPLLDRNQPSMCPARTLFTTGAAGRRGVAGKGRSSPRMGPEPALALGPLSPSPFPPPDARPISTDAAPFPPDARPISTDAAPFPPDVRPISTDATPFPPDALCLIPDAFSFFPHAQCLVPRAFFFASFASFNPFALDCASRTAHRAIPPASGPPAPVGHRRWFRAGQDNTLPLCPHSPKAPPPRRRRPPRCPSPTTL
jgi:hypothetical protein